VDLISSAGSILKQLRAAVPDAVVIDLTRQPSPGREVAIAIRAGKTIKHLPILFVDGDPEKVEAIRRMLPDAAFTTRSRLNAALKKARPVENPVRPPPMMERFGNRTTAQKLGITAGMRVAVVDPPADYERVIGALPERGNDRRASARGSEDYAVVHARSGFVPGAPGPDAEPGGAQPALDPVA